MMKDIDPAPYVEWFENLKREDVERVGGKNSSLGEMVSQLAEIGISVPPGYATTSDAYWHNLAETNLKPVITKEIDLFTEGKKALSLVGSTIRGAIAHAPTPKDLEKEIIGAYIQLGNRVHEKNPSVAVRSSATAEDLPEASFAGQQETYLNVRGEQQLLQACRNCWASLFTDRAIVYRQEHGK
jgi:pyruvate,water dikinase